ncbi:peptide ABC transporter substrate-binding protein [Brevibacillus choshinensis]|uniref:Peptide ABC transporter substrate-binding protein n=2 Tax=Brevibacillus choshinensis TaxID=54911 RepID=A0ABX7FX89_BRECH|nr:peptide ABC transporter substrate-binding protein [Brevibacillus choshinensis]
MNGLLCASVLAAAAGAAMAADAKPEQKAEQSVRKEMYLNLYSEPPTLDPGLGEENLSFAVIRATFDGLTRIGADGQIHPSAAEKIDISNDLRTYTFHLREAKWSNGDRVTARDFEYAWKRVLDPRTGANYAYQLYAIKNGKKVNRGEAKVDDLGIKALDDKTLQVTLEAPTPYFSLLTSFPSYYPVNQKVAESNGKWADEAATHVGNGPFKLESWDHKEKLVLAKNPTYWDKDAVKLDKLHFTMVEDEYTEFAMFENGELDWAGSPTSSLPYDELLTLREDGKLKTQGIAGTYWYKFNTEQAPFNNAKIRKAFAYAIDRASLIHDVLQTNQIPATAAVPPSMTLKEGGYFTDHDVTTAKKLLAEGMKESGITKLPPITLSFNTSEAHKKIADEIQSQWKENLGVDVQLVNKEWKVYMEDLHEGNYQIGRMGWLGDFNDPINFLELYKEKDGNNNDTNWENPKYKALLDQSATEKDPAKRLAILTEAEQILMDEMPIMPIYFYTNSWVQDETLQGVVIDGLGYVDFKWASFTN